MRMLIVNRLVAIIAIVAALVALNAPILLVTLLIVMDAKIKDNLGVKLVIEITGRTI